MTLNTKNLKPSKKQRKINKIFSVILGFVLTIMVVGQVRNSNVNQLIGINNVVMGILFFSLGIIGSIFILIKYRKRRILSEEK